MVLLSICIPTYNRKNFLKDTIESIISQPEFLNSNDVNIVISDNSSTDGTKELVKDYCRIYGNKILYSRNDTNIGFANFDKVLSIANGEFLKLNNDTLLLKPGSLAKILYYVKNNLNNKNILFFRNSKSRKSADTCLFDSINDFVRDISYYSTWIGSFGIWKNDYNNVSNIFKEKNYSEIPHTYVLLSFLENHRNILCVNEELFDSVCPPKKGGNYNVAQVFGYNYLTFLNEFKSKALLSNRVYKDEKRVLLKFINDYYFDIDGKFNFQKSGYFRYLLKFYWFNFYFYRYYFKMRICSNV